MTGYKLVRVIDDYDVEMRRARDQWCEGHAGPAGHALMFAEAVAETELQRRWATACIKATHDLTTKMMGKLMDEVAEEVEWLREKYGDENVCRDDRHGYGLRVDLDTLSFLISHRDDAWSVGVLERDRVTGDGLFGTFEDAVDSAEGICRRILREDLSRINTPHPDDPTFDEMLEMITEEAGDDLPHDAVRMYDNLLRHAARRVGGRFAEMVERMPDNPK